MSEHLQNKTIRDFGDQWSRYQDNSGFYASSELFLDMLEPLLPPDKLRNKIVADIGSGSGRIVKMILAAGAEKVYAVEPSSEAFETLRRNTVDVQSQIEYLNIPGDALDQGLNLDYVLSIGVIHHIPQPEATISACLKALKPGGQCLIWLYGREGNDFYLKFVEPLRKLTVKLPHVVLAGLSHLMNVMLGIYILLCRAVPLPMRGYMLKVIGKMSWAKRYLVIYDQLNPAYAKYYTRQEAHDLLVKAGFVSVETHHRHGYSWTVLGTRPGNK